MKVYMVLERAFHPDTGLVYFGAQMSAFEYGIDPEYSYNKGGRNLGVIARPGALPRVEGEAPPANTWFAAWDLCFHTITFSLIDTEFAKQQLLQLLVEFKDLIP